MEILKFVLILIAMGMSYKVLELISYTVCWINSDNETKEKLINKGNKLKKNIFDDEENVNDK